jgi:hypothetical protein
MAYQEITHFLHILVKSLPEIKEEDATSLMQQFGFMY